MANTEHVSRFSRRFQFPRANSGYGRGSVRETTSVENSHDYHQRRNARKRATPLDERADVRAEDTEPNTRCLMPDTANDERRTPAAERRRSCFRVRSGATRCLNPGRRI